MLREWRNCEHADKNVVHVPVSLRRHYPDQVFGV
jgi:hypothetical protein